MEHICTQIIAQIEIAEKQVMQKVVEQNNVTDTKQRLEPKSLLFLTLSQFLLQAPRCGSPPPFGAASEIKVSHRNTKQEQEILPLDEKKKNITLIWEKFRVENGRQRLDQIVNY